MDIRTQKFAIACLARIHIHGLTLLSLLKSQLLECGLWGSDFRKQAVFHYAMLSEATHVPCFHSIQAKLVCLKPRSTHKPGSQSSSLPTHLANPSFSSFLHFSVCRVYFPAPCFDGLWLSKS